MEVIFFAEWGHLLLWCALGLSLLPLFAYPLIENQFKTAQLFSLGQLLLVALSFICLIFNFIYDDFTVQYVAANSHSTLPWYYKMTAVWGAHEGSLLLWVLILAFWGYLLSRDKYLPKQVLLMTTLVILALLSLVLFSSNPFLRWLPDSPPEGLDLNPLLQDLAFVIHPPMLYLGYVGFVMPFIITMSTLLSPENFSIEKYVYLMRKWSLLAFGFLTLGIALGSWWAYYELGWGGWWFWDPVENASFMPWLSGLALIHSLYIVKNKPNVIGWVMILAIVTFGLSIFGTFLVRSGIITSVHSFASDPERGLFLLAILAVMIGSAFTLYLIKAKYFVLPSTHKMNRFKLNSQTLAIGASVVLFCLMIVVLLGTTYPILAEIIFSENVTIGLPYFNKVTLPFFILLLLLATVGPYLPFKKKQYVIIVFSLLLSVIVALICFSEHFYAGLGLFLGLWLGLNTVLNLFVDYQKQIKKIGMVMAHMGFAIATIGAVVNTQMVIDKEVALSVNEAVKVGGYNIKLLNLGERTGPNYTAKTAIFSIDASREIKTEKRYYTNRQMALSETGILPGLMQDIYISLGEPIDTHTWSVKIIIHPLVRWVWLGAIFIALGAMLSFIKLLFYKPKIR